MEQNRLILLGRYNQQFVQNELIPEIENNCLKYGVLFPDAYEVFRKTNLLRIVCIFIIYMLKAMCQSDRNTAKLRLRTAMRYCRILYRTVIQGCYAFLRLSDRSPHHLLCVGIMNLV